MGMPQRWNTGGRWNLLYQGEANLLNHFQDKVIAPLALKRSTMGLIIDFYGSPLLASSKDGVGR